MTLRTATIIAPQHGVLLIRIRWDSQYLRCSWGLCRLVMATYSYTSARAGIEISGLISRYRRNLNNWTVCYVVGLSSPSKVKKFLFFFSLGRGKGAVFLLCFCPLSREGNSGLHSTPSNYSSFYGRQTSV